MLLFEKDKAYMEVLCEFHNLINTKYIDGGWLETCRALCSRLNVSKGTYTKAVARLVGEGIAERIQPKGIYIIPKKYRTKKIGLVIGNGEESPFLYGQNIIPKILYSLNKKGYHTQLIQGNSSLNVARSAMSHYVSGLIWLNTPNPDYDSLRDIFASKLIPLICINIYTPYSEEDVAPSEIPCVSEDYVKIGETLASPFIKRGHQKVAYIGTKVHGLTPALQNAGLTFDDNSYIDHTVHTSGKLIGLIQKQEITGLIISGGARQIESTFEELSTLSEDIQPEILVNEIPMLPEIKKKYPSVKIIGSAKDNTEEFGPVAVDMLLDNLDKPEKMTSVKVKTFQVSIQHNLQEKL